MATTEQFFNGNGSDKDFTYTFPIYQDGDIKAEVDHVATTAFTLLTSPTRVRFNSAPASGTNNIRLFRDTDVDTSKATFVAGSAIRATDLNNNMDQILYSLQEQSDRLVQRTDIKDGAINNAKIAADAEIAVSKLADGAARQILQTDTAGTGVEWTSNVDIPGTLDVTGNTTVDGNLEVTGTFAVTGTSSYTGQQTVPGGALVKDIRVGLDGNNEVSTASGNLVLDSATGTVAVDDALTVAGSLTVTGTTNLAAGSIGTSEIADQAVSAGKIGNNTITGLQIADNAISAAEIAANAVTAAKVNADAIGTTKIIDDAVTTAKIDSDAVTGAEIADNAIDSEHYTDGSIDSAHIANGAVNRDQLATDAIITVKITDGNVTTDKIANSAINVDKLANNAINVDKIADNAVTAAKIADATIVTTAEQAASTPDDVTFFTTAAAEARYFNTSSSETIKDGVTFPDNDTTIATTAAINDRIIDLVDDVGGFVPTANETSFPNANPDVNNGAGTIVSVSTLASDHTSNGSGVITISNGTVGNSTVTINGAANSTTYSAGYGFLVETTTTLNTYTFHRLVPKATEVTTVAGKATEIGRLGTADAVADMNLLGTTAIVEDMDLLGTTACVADMALLGTTACIADMATIADTSNLIANIGTVAGIQANVTTVAGVSANVTTVATNITSVNDFAARYRVASSAPSSSLDTGDLYFDTSANELKVYNGSAWQGGVTATGNFASITGNTFTGSNTYNDTVKAIFGTSGDGLEIYHSGSHSYLKDGGTGNLRILSNEVLIANPADDENIAKFIENGAVELYHDNSKKLETASWGTQVHGTLATTSHVDIASDSGILKLGASADLQIYHDGSHATLDNDTGDTYIKAAGMISLNPANTEDGLLVKANGAVELMYDNSKKFETTSAGGTLTGALTVTNEINLFNGTTNASRYIDAGLGDSNSLVLRGCSGGDTGHETLAQFTRGGAAELYHDNTKKFETTSTGCNGPGGWQSPDGQAYRAGNSNDLLIYHDSANNSFYEHTNASGNIYFRNDGSTTYFQMGTSDESSLILNKDGSVELYYDNSKKFNTTSNGVQVTGDLLCDNATNAGKDIQWDESANKFYYFDDVKAVFGDDSDLEIYHDGTSGNSIIDNNTGQLRLQGDLVRLMNSAGSEVYLEGNVNGNVELYYDNSKKFETTNDGVELHGDIQLDDNTLFGGDAAKIRLGASQDLEIYHDGSNSILKDSSSGHFKIVGDSIAFRNQADNEDLAYFVADGAAKLYHNGIEMFETMAGGVRSGNGILFGTDTAAANRLSDYEEGTWTPALGGSGNSFTYHANTGGVYTKVGRMVYASGYIQLSARSGTSQLVLTGLPFAAGDHSTGSSAIEGGVHTHRVDNCAAGTSGPMGTIASSQSEASLWHAISSGNGSALNADEIDTTFVWGFSVMYPA